MRGSGSTSHSQVLAGINVFGIGGIILVIMN